MLAWQNQYNGNRDIQEVDAMNPFFTFANQKCSRKNFLQISIGAAAAIAVMKMPRLSAAAKMEFTPISLSQCPTDPLIIAQKSQNVQNAYKKVLTFINKITDRTLREKVLAIIQYPAPTIMEQYTSNSSVERTYQKLLHKKLIDPATIRWETLFPTYQKPTKPVQLFISAPGSGYGSHHAYPGGLAIHTAINLGIADSICSIYQDTLSYDMNRDVVLAAEALHDLAKPWVFQWNKDGSCFKELTIAGTGSHHILSIAESIHRKLPAEVIVAQACAHNHPGTPKDEADVVSWIQASSIIAGVDPVALGLLAPDGTSLPLPHKQEGYITHLGDHDFVLSVPAAQNSIQLLKKLAQSDYGMTSTDLEGIRFNKFRNYIGAQLSFMQLDHTAASPDPSAGIKNLVAQVITK